jgi:hypothetical protein
MSIFSANIFTRLDWLTRKVNILLAYMARTIQQKRAEDEANPTYLEFTFGSTPAITTVAGYNALFGDINHNPNFIPFTGLITTSDIRTQRLYGGGNVQINNGDISGTDLIIVDDPAGKIVSLSDSALAYTSGLKYVNLPGLTEISGYECFYGCTGLQYVNMPNVTEIRDNAFSTFDQCDGLLYVNLPRLESIGIGAYETFEGCISLENISLPSLTHILSSKTFGSCTGLKNISLPLCTVYGDDRCDQDSSTFVSIVGVPQTINLTISQTAYSGCGFVAGGMDADINALVTSNTVNITVA